MMKGKKRVIVWILLVCVLLGVLTEAALLVLVVRSAKIERNGEPSDCLIVLGALVWPDRRPSDALLYRLEAALSAYERGVADKFIVCGAKGADEPEYESAVMKEWLTARGVPAESIFEERDSYNTLQNLQNAKKIMAEQGFSTAAVVTSDYHETRALWLASDLGIDACGVNAASPRPFMVIWKLRVRETLSWIKYWLTRGRA